MKKERFFIIKGKQYGTAIAYFRSLDKAMEMFKFLSEGNTANVEGEYISGKGKLLGSNFHYIEKDNSDYHLSSELIEIYTKEEIEKIEKERRSKK